MGNLSKRKRERMLAFLNTLKSQHNDDKTIRALNEIENHLREKKYGLVWEEHMEYVDKKLQDYIPVFCEDDKRKIVSGDSLPYNFIIEGDNLQSLYLLEKTHKGEIDVIYIDPPYNTGNQDFIYNDRYVNKDDTYRHSKWISFMEKRLRLAYSLLAEDGVIFISIDDNEYAQLKLLCDEIFNEHNFLSTHHIQVRYAEKSLADGKPIKPVMEYVLIYAKDATLFDINLPKEEYTEESFRYSIEEKTEGQEVIADDGTRLFVFKPDEWSITKHDVPKMELLKETWVSGTIYTKMSYGQVVRNYIEPRYEIDGRGCLYKIMGRGDDGLGYRYYVGPQRVNATRCKMYSGMPLERVQEIRSGAGSFRDIPLSNFYDFAADFGNIAHEGGVTFNSGKKPVKMLMQLINYHKGKDTVVLDFFAGSGSTAHAVLEANKNDGGNRKFIICTNNEITETDRITYLVEKGFIKKKPRKGTNAEKEWLQELDEFLNSDAFQKLFNSSEYQSMGICRNKTYPRVKTVITGMRPDGTNYPGGGIPANLKYFKCDWIDRKPENHLLSNALCLHVKEMIELQNHIEIDQCKNVVILNKDDFKNTILNKEVYDKTENVWVNQNIIFSSTELELLESKDFKYIPKEFFGQELREVAE